MTPEQLRMSILHAAFQGKLVEQRAEEGDAELLYKQCQSDILTAIKLGEIKKQKPLSEITDDDIVFDIPSSWRNIKLGEVSQLIDGEKVKGKEYKYLEVKYLRGSIEAKTLTEGKLAKQGQLAILVDGENSGEVFTLPEDGYLGSTFKVLYIVNTIDVEYVLKFFELKRSELRANKKGAAIPHLNKDLLFNYVLPLPPLEEQHRIVAKIEELLPYVDRYAEAYEKLEQFNAKFPEDMKKSILQYAIQGKLVEQRPEEGTAEELYQQIQDEKQRLIKEGKLKKEKPLAKITEDEIPFDIPESWKWCKMGSLYNIHSSKRVHAKDYTKEGIPFYRSMEVVSLAKGIEPTVQYYISEEQYNGFVKDQYIMPQKDDLLITCIGGSIGWTWIVDDSKFYYKDGNVVAFDKCNGIDTKYLYYWLNSPKFVEQVQIDVGGTAYNALTIDMLKNYLLPLPPIEEQHRIVSKIEEMLPYCDRLVK